MVTAGRIIGRGGISCRFGEHTWRIEFMAESGGHCGRDRDRKRAGVRRAMAAGGIAITAGAIQLASAL
jgi:hypothetical protein